MALSARYEVDAELSDGVGIWVQAKAPGESLRSWDERCDALVFARRFATIYGALCRVRCGDKIQGYVNSDGEVS